MNPRVEYEMSEKDLKEILDSCKPVPCISFNGMNNAFSSPQENANRAWKKLGDKMGFDSMTVRPDNKGQRFFTAIPSETGQQREEREKRETKENTKIQFDKLSKEATEKNIELLKFKKENLNICEDCNFEPPTCKSNPKFGCGKGNDNVYECDSFMRKN